MDWEEIKRIEGGLLLLNAENQASMLQLISDTSSKLFDGTSNFDTDPNGRRLSSILPELSKGFEAEGIRVGIVADSWAVLEKRMKMASDSLDDQNKWPFLSKQNIFISDSPPLGSDDLLAHMYPGQGSQYVGMTLDLAKRFGVIRKTWEEADVVMNEIIGEPLSEFVLR